MAELQDFQWELGGVVFGLDCRVQHEPEVSPGGYDLRTQDVPNPIGDAISMGRDRKTPTSWAFKLFVDQSDDVDALDALDELASVWDGDEIRLKPGEYMPLRYRLAGRSRRVYGRPRRWTAPLSNQLLNGYIQITADFKMVSPLFFDDEENAVPVLARPAVVDSGFDVPFDEPIDFVGDAAPTYQSITIGGRKKTPIVLDFDGPSVDPVVTIGGSEYRLNGIIPANETITLDGRPWVHTARRKDGAAVTGSMVSRLTRLQDLALPPGEHAVTYTNRDTSGQGGVTVRWRNAHTAP